MKARDSHTLEITVYGRYPQFANWLTMAFFAPVPWEATAFYGANPLLKKNNVTLEAWPVGTGPYPARFFAAKPGARFGAQPRVSLCALSV